MFGFYFNQKEKKRQQNYQSVFSAQAPWGKAEKLLESFKNSVSLMVLGASHVAVI